MTEVKRKTRKIPFNLQFFAEPLADPPADPPQDPPADPPAPPKKLEMTQEEFDAKIAERLARDRKKYSDYDDVKTKLADFEKADEERRKAAMTEQERLQAEKAESDRKAQEAETKAQQALEAANQRLVKAEFRVLARELGVRPDALDDAFVLADKSAVKVGEDGTVEGVKDVIEALIKAKPFLAEQAKREARTIGNPSNPNADQTTKTAEQLLRDAAEKARTSGRIEDVVAYSELKLKLSQ